MFKGFLKKVFLFGVILLFGWFSFKLFATPSQPVLPNPDLKKSVTLVDNGLIFESQTSAQKIEDFLKEKGVILQENDAVSPEKNEQLVPRSFIEIRRAVNLNVAADGKKLRIISLGRIIKEALIENGITLGKLDKTDPEADELLRENMTIVITRINIEEKVEIESIPFKTVEKTDAKLSWREKKVEQKGQKGQREIKYKITYKNGKEVSRIILEKKIIQDPVSEIIIQGAFVKTGKAHKGLGTWYAWKGGLFAANPWLPMGSYVKVTNLDNGKSVIVQINDRGPFGPNRIIDLDKVAFAKIASVGAGVINVKMEEIIN